MKERNLKTAYYNMNIKKTGMKYIHTYTIKFKIIILKKSFHKILSVYDRIIWNYLPSLSYSRQRLCGSDLCSAESVWRRTGSPCYRSCRGLGKHSYWRTPHRKSRSCTPGYSSVTKSRLIVYFYLLVIEVHV